MTHTMTKMLEDAGSAEWHFFRSFIGAALWSTSDDDNTPLDQNYDIGDFDPNTLKFLATECARFYETNAAYIHCDGAPLASDMEGPIACREASQAGHDFWLTRCGHGAGFWDGDWPEPAATELTNQSKASGIIDIYVGDDGAIYA